MKTKLSRVLVMLLAIAMMIPSFALADTPTLTLTGTTAITQYYNAADRQVDTNATKYTVAGIPATTTNGKIEWTIDNAKSFSFAQNERKSSTTDTGTINVVDHAVPSVYLTERGFDEVLANAGKTDVSATISGQLYVDYQAVGTPVKFTVKVSKVDVKGIKFSDAIGTNPTQIDLGSSSSKTEPVYQYVNLERDEAIQAQPSYGINDVFYKITEGGEYAYVNNYGTIYFQKPSEGKKIKVVAYIPGSANASLEKSAAVHEYTVIGPGSAQTAQDPEVKDTYQFVAFTTGAEGKVYTTSYSSVSLYSPGYSELLKTIPANPGVGFADELDWDIDKPQYATLYQDPQSKFVSLYFDTTLNLDEYPPVTVTVASKQNPSVKDVLVVQYAPKTQEEEEDKGYTTLAFQPFTETTVVEGTPDDPSEVNLSRYLVSEKDVNSKDVLVWENDKKLPITLVNGKYTISGLTEKLSPVTVTVKSMVSRKSAPFKINVVKKVPVDKSYTKVEFGVQSYTTAVKTVNIWPFLKLEGDGQPSQLIFTSSDPSIATVTKDVSGTQVNAINVQFKGTPKDGDKVTIEVRNGVSSATAEPSTLEITYVENEEVLKTYKVGFTKESLDVDKSLNTIGLKAYVYVQDKDGNKVDKPDEILEHLIWTSDNNEIATVIDGTATLKKAKSVVISIRPDYSTDKVQSITLNIKDTEEQKLYKVGFTKDSLDVNLADKSIDLENLKPFIYVQYKDGKPVTDKTEINTVLGNLIWTSENKNKAVVSTVKRQITNTETIDVPVAIKFIEAGKATISIRPDYSTETMSSITLNIKGEDLSDKIKGIKFSTDKEIELKVFTEADVKKLIENNELDRYMDYFFDASKYLVFTDIDGKTIDVTPEIIASLEWTSTDNTIAVVAEGVVIPLKEGTATINVRYNGGAEKQTASLKIKVVKADEKVFTKVKFAEPKTLDAHIDKNVNIFDAFNYLALEGEGDKDDLKWFSSDETIATVIGGFVTFDKFAKDGDTVKITVRYDEGKEPLTDTLTLKVVYDKKPYTELKFIEEKLNVVGTADLENYLTTKGNEYEEDTLVWTSENQQIALVDEDGDVTVQEGAVDGDTVKITVRSKLDSTKTASITLTVKKDPVKITKITLTQDTFELEPKGTIYLGRYVVTEPVDHEDTLFYTSDDPSVVMHNNDAQWDANLYEDGEAHITVRSTLNPDVSAKFTIKLKAKGVESIEFKDAPKTFYKKIDRYVGDKAILKTLDLWDYLVVKPVEFDKANLTWESSDPTVATAEAGYVSYVNAGTVTITVTDKISGKTASVELTLAEKHPVETITLKNIKMEVDENYDLTKGFITYTPANADFDPANIKWTSSNREVAEVQATEGAKRWTTGSVIKAYKAGKTTITANYEREDGTFIKAKCTVTVKDVKLEDVKFAQSKYTLKLNSKLEAKIRFNLEPFNCSYEEGDIYVISSKNDVVSVSPVFVDAKSHKGYVTITAKAPGTAWVTVKRSSNDKALDACKVVVKAVKVKSVKWKEKSLKLYWYNDGITEHYDSTKTNTVYKNSVDVKPIIQPANAYCKVTFETTDPGVAFVNDQSRLNFQNAISSGKPLPPVTIEAVGPGACKIVVKVDDGKKVRKASLNVEVETKKIDLKISQSKATLKLEKGSDVLYLRAYDADTDKDVKVKWTSSDTKVAKVNADGKVRAVGAGTATITATTKEGQKLTVKCKVTVKAPSTENEAAKKITGESKVTVKAGEKKALEIKVKPEGAKVTFTSSDSKIVKVTKDGTIKGIKAGKATITVKAVEGKAELKIKVIVK